ELLNTYMFFFSSRRRHTRFSRDWSSDVCSSDLTYQFALYITAAISYFALAVPALVYRNEQLKNMAMVDLLTELPTYWVFTTVVTQVMKSSLPNQNHSLAVFNLDNFGLINQNYGHTIGDEALRQTTTIIQ